MANVRKGFKRVMGEIPEDMHEKITLYNKISDRPLNVSRAIELCIENAVKKIEAELIAEAADNGPCGKIEYDEFYDALQPDIEDGLSAYEIHKHFVDLLKHYGQYNSNIKMVLYPIDNIGIADNEIIFYAKRVDCFSVGPTR